MGLAKITTSRDTKMSRNLEDVTALGELDPRVKHVHNDYTLYIYICIYMIYGGLLSHRSIPTSSKSLDHTSLLGWTGSLHRLHCVYCLFAYTSTALACPVFHIYIYIYTLYIYTHYIYIYTLYIYNYIYINAHVYSSLGGYTWGST